MNIIYSFPVQKIEVESCCIFTSMYCVLLCNFIVSK
jgi:hypothetical protein